MNLPATIECAEICSCHWVSTGTSWWKAVARLCDEHDREYQKTLYQFYKIAGTPQYERWFDSEADAKDCLEWIHRRYPGAGYGTTGRVYQINNRWLLLAWWGSCE